VRRRPRSLGSAVTAVAVLGLVCAVCVMRAEDVGKALESVSVWAAIGAVAIHVVTLVMRSDAWRLTLAAAGGDSLSRSAVHSANAAAFVAGALQSQAARCPPESPCCAGSPATALRVRDKSLWRTSRSSRSSFARRRRC